MMNLAERVVFANLTHVCVFQLAQAAAGKFNLKVHVEYDWNLRLEELDESDDDLDDKVRRYPVRIFKCSP